MSVTFTCRTSSTARETSVVKCSSFARTYTSPGRILSEMMFLTNAALLCFSSKFVLASVMPTAARMQMLRAVWSLPSTNTAYSKRAVLAERILYVRASVENSCSCTSPTAA